MAPPRDGREPELPEYSYARRRGGPVLDPALRRIALGAGAVSVLVIVVALLWSGLRPGLGFGGAPPLIAAPGTPLRIAPAQPGGLQVPGANEQIMSGAADQGAPQLAPAGPQADLGALQQDANVGATKPPPPAPTPPAAPPPAPAAPPAALAATGSVEVQLAATGTEAAAHRLWATLAQQQPKLLAGHSPLFIPVTVNGKSVWRLRLPGFADQASAAAFCAGLGAQGVACTVAKF